MEKSEKITNKQGLKLQVTSWESQNAKLNLVVIHGLTDSSSSFYKFIETLRESTPINVYTLDLTGHGLSEGEKGYISKFEFFIDDVNCLKDAKVKNSLPTIVLGHSMGGIIASQLALESNSELAGLILIAPGFEPGLKFRRCTEILAILGAKALPKLDISYFWNKKVKSKSKSRVLKLNLFAQLSIAARSTLKGKKKLDIPVLIIHGTKDPLANIKGSEEFKNIHASNATILKPPVEIHHLIYSKSTLEFVLKSVEDWINLYFK